MFVKPGENRENPGTLMRVLVPPHFARMPDEGQEVPDNMFWRWMLRHGDVVEAEAPEPPAEPLRLTAVEWARVGDAKLDPDGPAAMGFSVAAAEQDRDPAAPLMTHEEYAAKTVQPEAGA